MNHERFAEGDYTLLGSRDTSLEEEEVVLYNTVVGEATHGSNTLLRNIVVGGGVVLLPSEANTVDLLVDLCSVVVTICDVEALLR